MLLLEIIGDNVDEDQALPDVSLGAISGHIHVLHDDSESDESSGPGEESDNELRGYESSDEEDFRNYDNDVPSWQQGLSALDQLAEEFDIESVLRGAISFIVFLYGYSFCFHRNFPLRR